MERYLIKFRIERLKQCIKACEEKIKQLQQRSCEGR